VKLRAATESSTGGGEGDFGGGEWIERVLGCLWARLEGARGLQAGRVVLAVVGMGATHLRARLPGEDDRRGGGLGCGKVSWAGVAQVGGLLSFFLFSFLFSSVICFGSAIKILSQFIKMPK